MFVKCKLQLTQDNNSLEVVLHRAGGASYADLATFWGKFTSSDGGVPEDRKLWTFAFAKSELRLMDGGGAGVGMVGGGLKFGELGSLPPSAVLPRAIMVNHGLKPSESSGVGVGQILNAAELSVRFRNGPAHWQLVAYQSEGSNAWNSL